MKTDFLLLLTGCILRFGSPSGSPGPGSSPIEHSDDLTYGSFGAGMAPVGVAAVEEAAAAAWAAALVVVGTEVPVDNMAAVMAAFEYHP